MKDWQELAAQLRVDSIRCTTAAGSGHPTSSHVRRRPHGGAAGQIPALRLGQPPPPQQRSPDLQQGPRLPAALLDVQGGRSDHRRRAADACASSAAGLQGHPNPHVLPYVDVATGSLGQGLPIGVGMALNGKYLDKLPYRVWVVLGDSEMAEGSIWEAFDKASYYKLDNLIGILDMNRLGQRGETDLGWNSAAYAARAAPSAGTPSSWTATTSTAIDRAYAEAMATEGPADLPGRQDGEGPRRRRSWTTRTAGTARRSDAEQAKAAIAELGGERHLTVPTAKPEDRSRPPRRPRSRSSCRPTRSAARRRRARPTATRWSRVGASRPEWSPWTARCPTRPRRRVQEGLPRPLLRDVHRRAAARVRRRGLGRPGQDGSSPRRSPPSSPGLTTRSAWRRSPTPPSIWSARTPGSASARTARRRWAWKTWR